MTEGKRPGSLHAGDLDWQPAEWATKDQNVLVTVQHGYELVVEENEDESWSWQVKATSAIAETPEVIDAGEAPSRGNAKVKACAVVNRLPKSAKATKPEVVEMLTVPVKAKRTPAKKTAPKPKTAKAPTGMSTPEHPVHAGS